MEAISEGEGNKGSENIKRSERSGRNELENNRGGDSDNDNGGNNGKGNVNINNNIIFMKDCLLSEGLFAIYCKDYPKKPW